MMRMQKQIDDEFDFVDDTNDVDEHAAERRKQKVLVAHADISDDDPAKGQAKKDFGSAY